MAYLVVGELTSESTAGLLALEAFDFQVCDSLAAGLGRLSDGGIDGLAVSTRLPAHELLLGLLRELGEFPAVALVDSFAEGLGAVDRGFDDFVAHASGLPAGLGCKFVGAGDASMAPARGKVLVADGSALHRAVFARLLVAAGFEVLSAGGVPEAAALASAQPLSAVVVDLALPQGRADDVRRAAARPRGECASLALRPATAADSAMARAIEAGFLAVHDKRRPIEEALCKLASALLASGGPVGELAPVRLPALFRVGHEPGWRTGIVRWVNPTAAWVEALDVPSVGVEVRLRFAGPDPALLYEVATQCSYRKPFWERGLGAFRPGAWLTFQRPPVTVSEC